MTIQERLLLSGCVAGLQIAEVAIESSKLRYYHVILCGLVRRVAGGSRPISALAFFGQRNIGAKGRARAVSSFGIGFLTPCLKETAGIKFDHSKTIQRERTMLRKIMLAAFVVAFAGGAALAQETCESKAVGKDGKPLAGAAKASSMKKCMADTCATKAVSQDGKPLSGAAKTSFMKKCEKGA